MKTPNSHSPIEAPSPETTVTPRPRARSIFRVLADLRLRVKLVLSFMAVVILSAAASTLVTDGVVRNELAQQVGQDLRSRAASVANEIGVELLRNRDLLQTIATDRFTREAVKAANVTNSADLAEIQRLDQQWRAADAAGNDADPLVSKILSNDIAVELRKFRDNFPQHVEIFVTDRNGSNIASTNRTSDYYQADEDWWQAAYHNGQGAVYIGQPEFDESSKTYSINMAVPLYADDGQTVAGIVRTTLDASALKAILGRAHFGQSGEIDLRVAPDTAIDRNVEVAFKQIDPDMASHLAVVADSYGEFKYEGSSRLVSQIALTGRDSSDAPVFAQLAWSVIAHQQLAEAFQPVDSVTSATLFVALGALLVAGLAAFGIAQLIAGPIVRLTAVAEKVRTGDLSAQASVETRDEVGTLATAFNTMTLQLRNLITGLEQRVADRTRALATSTEVSRKLSTILDREQLVREVVEQMQSAFGYYHTQIYLTDPHDQSLIMAGGTGEAGATLLARGHSLPKGRGLVGRAADTNTAILISDVSQDPNWLPNPLLQETKSEVAVPIAVGAQVRGVLDVQHNIVDGLQQQDVDLIQSVANQVAVALQNIQSTEIITKRATELQTVATISTAAATISSIEEMLHEVVHLTQRGFGLYHAHVFAYNENTAELQIVACGYREGDKHEGTHGTTAIPLEQEQSLVARAARTRQAVIVNDVRNEPGWLPNPQLPDTASEMAVPMIVGDQVLGVLDVQSERRNAFSDEDASIQSTLASQVATALQNARSFTQSQRQAERETAVNLITQKIQNTTSVESALQVAVRELGHSLGMPTSAQLRDSESGNSLSG